MICSLFFLAFKFELLPSRQEETLPKERGGKDKRHHEPGPERHTSKGTLRLDWLRLRFGQFCLAAPTEVFVVRVPGITFGASHASLPSVSIYTLRPLPNPPLLREGTVKERIKPLLLSTK